MPRPSLVLACLVAATGLAPRPSVAHFILQSPASWRAQNVYGDPQKTGPCGDEGGAATTGVVTAFAPGETITITIDETIYHPGHYRVALAAHDRSELPEPPPVTPDQTSDCGSAPIAETPVFPILADGVLAHTAPFTEPQTIQVTLPSDVTCERCTLQVIAFMRDHAAPCFYHHCADISIAPGNGGGCPSVDEVTLPDFLGVLRAPPCASEPVPPRIGALFDEASTLVARAAETPAKAERLLLKASKRLRSAARKTTKAGRRKISTDCAEALSGVLGEAQAGIGCLRGGA